MAVVFILSAGFTAAHAEASGSPATAFIIDTSASMRGLPEGGKEKPIWGDVMDAAAAEAEKIPDGARFILYTFDDGLRSRKEWAAVDSAKRAEITGRIRGLRAEGSWTRLLASLDKVWAELPDDVDIFLFTDAIEDPPRKKNEKLMEDFCLSKDGARTWLYRGERPMVAVMDPRSWGEFTTESEWEQTVRLILSASQASPCLKRKHATLKISGDEKIISRLTVSPTSVPLDEEETTLKFQGKDFDNMREQDLKFTWRLEFTHDFIRIKIKDDYDAVYFSIGKPDAISESKTWGWSCDASGKALSPIEGGGGGGSGVAIKKVENITAIAFEIVLLLVILVFTACLWRAWSVAGGLPAILSDISLCLIVSLVGWIFRLSGISVFNPSTWVNPNALLLAVIAQVALMACLIYKYWLYMLVALGLASLTTLIDRKKTKKNRQQEDRSHDT